MISELDFRRKYKEVYDKINTKEIKKDKKVIKLINIGKQINIRKKIS
jgi:hypothetical protein